MEKFDNFFKDQLAEHEIAPPAGFWHQISEQLNHDDQAEVITIPAKKTIWFKPLLRIAAVAIIALGVGSLIVMQNNNNQKVISSKLEVPSSVLPSKIPAVQPKETNVQVAVNTPQTVAPTQKSYVAAKASVKEVKVVPATVVEENTAPVVALQEEKVIPAKENDNMDIQNTSIPVYSLKLLNSKVPENDEITIIENNKGEKVKQDSKKVIIIEKNISKKPEIYFQVPLRF